MNMVQEDKAMLNQMGKDAQNIIYRVEQAFPYNLFPDSVTIDKNKIDKVEIISIIA